ncbi:MAG TPA: hypothetical protein VEC12_08265 [Bacteroidia bacterium]|nr:hypothetical protein [Bacteroidia bacterium]
MTSKLKPDPVRWGKHFCIAKMENNSLIEIEGRWTNGEYTVSLLHQPAYITTYQEYGIAADEREWQSAVALLYSQVAAIASACMPLPDFDNLPSRAA